LNSFGHRSLIRNKLVCRDRRGYRRRQRCSWGTQKGSSSIDRGGSRDCRDFRKEEILTQMGDTLEFPREIRDQSITLLAGRVLEQSSNVLLQFISL